MIFVCAKRKRRPPSGLDYTSLTAVQVYDYVVAGRILTFPNGYVIPENMKEILREVILKRHKLTKEEICKKVNYTYLKRFQLGGARRAFNGSMYELITYCFPEFNIKRWELNKVPNGYWKNKEFKKEFMLWVAEKEGIDLESVSDLSRITAKLIQSYGGSKVIDDMTVFEAIKLIAQTDVREWQVIKVPSWTDEKVKEAVRWLIEEKLKWSHDEVVEKISARVFYAHDLGGMLRKHCNHSPIKALQIAYPCEYTKLRNVRPEYLRKK